MAREDTMPTVTPKRGLRERKKLAAMQRIQEVALDLFDLRGFDDVTIEEIAAAAEVSPSSVYRYFGTKEQVVLWDELDVRLFDMVEAELASRPPVEAMRRALSAVMTEYFDRDEYLARRKTRYALEEPALRAALLEQTDELSRRVAEGLARASGQSVDELEPQVIATTMIWVMMAAARHWHTHGYRNPIRTELERALAIVERGL
jgi:AcrR family transcriptional regulator